MNRDVLSRKRRSVEPRYLSRVVCGMWWYVSLCVELERRSAEPRYKTRVVCGVCWWMTLCVETSMCMSMSMRVECNKALKTGKYPNEPCAQVSCCKLSVTSPVLSYTADQPNILNVLVDMEPCTPKQNIYKYKHWQSCHQSLVLGCPKRSGYTSCPWLHMAMNKVHV